MCGGARREAGTTRVCGACGVWWGSMGGAPLSSRSPAGEARLPRPIPAGLLLVTGPGTEEDP